jgi:hypothetical protein
VSTGISFCGLSSDSVPIPRCLLHISSYRRKETISWSKNGREPAHDLVNLLVPDWRPTASQVLWGIRIAVGLIILLSISSLIGDQYDKTVWDSAQLLLTASIPVVIAIVGNRDKQQRTQDDALQNYLDQMGELRFLKNS